MIIFNHKGQEKGPQDFSQEIDVRYFIDNDYDYGKDHRLVCAHDIDEVWCDAKDFKKYVRKWLSKNKDGMLAINIKEDGLALYLKEEIGYTCLPYDRFFCFDMSQKEVQQYKKAGLPIATSVSSYGVDYPAGDFLLFDWFPELPYSYEQLYKYCYAYSMYDTLFLGDEKFIAISPELHDEDFKQDEIRKFWKWCAEKKFFGIITDYPEEAEKFFQTK